jgi:hypothetical protein
MRKLWVVVVVPLLAGIAGCAGRPAAGPASPPSPPPPSGTGPANQIPDRYAGRFRAAGTVLQNAHHGPQLCFGVATSLPPQCGGLDIAGWTWTGLKHESVAGTSWGGYLVTGTYDGRVLTLTEAPKVDDGSLGPPPSMPDLTSPCPVPAGGWRPVDAAKATDNALQAATAMVNADPDFAGLWVDQKVPSYVGSTPTNDPAKLVLNVRFTKDLARHEAAIRKVWGGSLCVSAAKRPQAELTRIQDQLTGTPGMTGSSIDILTGTVEVRVFVATLAGQRELDARYGPGLVKMVGELKPID